jgi:phosphate transport system substrate-binding protein
LGKESVAVKALGASVLILILALAGLAEGAEASSDPGSLSGTIAISGAWALYPMAVRWAEEFQKIHPAVRVDIGAGGAGKGMADALAGVVDLGMVSRDIYPAEIEKGAWWVSVTKDAVVPVVSDANPVLEGLLTGGVARDTFEGIWVTGNVTTWEQVVRGGGGHPIRVYTRSDACGAAKTWASFLGCSQEELQGVGVYGDPGLADAVRRDALGIGFNNINYVYDAATKMPVGGLRVVPVDLNGDGEIGEGEDFYGDRDAIVAAIGAGVYPSPPARDLHMVSRGRPERPVVRAFLRWVLTEGQKYVSEAGYVRLAREKLDAEMAKLGEP